MTNLEILAKIYGSEDAPNLNTQIDELISNYQYDISESTDLSHGDILLITYGDSILSKDKNPLQSLHRFLNAYASPFSAVHILPFYPYTSDDGFSVVDYRKVNPELGSWQDIEELSGDYSIMFDAVINHISSKSEWVIGHLSDNEEVKNYVLEENPLRDWSNVVRPRTSPLLHEFVKSDGDKVHLWTTFSQDQIDLDYRNPKLLVEILDILCEYVKRGAKLIRLDAIGFMWKEEGTTCIHLPNTHLLIQLMRNVVTSIDPGAKLVTETNVPHIENISYFGNGSNEAHMVYNFTLPPLLAYSVLSENPTKLVEWASTLSLPTETTCFFNFLASHDGVGVRPVQGILDNSELNVLVDSCKTNGGRISYKTNPDGSQSPYELNSNYFSLLHGVESDRNSAIKRTLLAHAFLLSFPGLPAIYIHSLLGSENDIEGMQRTGQNRTINRKKLDWVELSSELSGNMSVRNEVYNPIIELISERKKCKAFNPYSPFKIEEVSDQIVRIERTNEGQRVSCYFNFSNQENSLELEGNCVNLLTHSTIGSESIHMTGYDFLWLSHLD
jgi:glycosidase